MAEKMIKVLMFSYHVEEEHPSMPTGQKGRIEVIARRGEVHDITWEYDLRRGEKYDAFFTDEERKAIEDGTYAGPDSQSLQALRNQFRVVQDLEDEGPSGESSSTYGPESIKGKTDEQIARLIIDDKLTVDQTLALTGGDKTYAERVLDAEGLVASEKGVDPRRGVVAGLEAQLAVG